MRGTNLHIYRKWFCLPGLLDIWKEKCNIELVHLVWMKVRPALIDSKVGAKVRANSKWRLLEQGKVMVRLPRLDLELAVMARMERWNRLGVQDSWGCRKAGGAGRLMVFLIQSWKEVTVSSL